MKAIGPPAQPSLIPYELSHFIALAPKQNLGRFNTSLFNTLRKEDNGPAYTIVHDNRLYGCVGLMLPWPGLGICWTILTKELLSTFPLWTWRTIRAFLHDAINACDLHRIEMLVAPEHVRWSRWLGFNEEVNGIARSYLTNKQDMYRMELLTCKQERKGAFGHIGEIVMSHGNSKAWLEKIENAENMDLKQLLSSQ